MTPYTTLDYLPDLTASQMLNARSLSFKPYSVPSVGWDRVAEVYGENAAALLHSVYKFTAVKGATYDLFSTSYFDPYLLRIYDLNGNTMVANDEKDDGAGINLTAAGGRFEQDVIYKWVAPYSGTYFVEASWNQGSYFKYYSLNIYEDKDSAGAPTQALVGQNTGNPKPSTQGLPGDKVIDAMTTGYQWALDGTRTIDFSISSGFGGEYWNKPAEVSANLKAALETFSQLANVKFNDLGQFADPRQAALAGSEINLSLDGQGLYFSSSSMWARAFFPSPAQSQSPYAGAAGDVYLNIKSQANTLPSYAPGSAGWFLLLHELGHSLGLKHPHDNGGNGRPTLSDIGFAALDIDLATIMSYNDEAFANLVQWDPATPMVLDALALQHLYGANTSTNAGDTVHRLAANNFYATLWDASGIDTLDVQSEKEGWTIYLPDVVLTSSASTLVGLAAPSADFQKQVPATALWLLGDFENVRGSALNDVIHSNALNNHIQAGQGLDTVVWPQAQAQYRITPTATGWAVQDTAQKGATDQLEGVERLRFSDHALALDLDGHAGTVAKTLGAVFGPASVGNLVYVGTGLYYLDVLNLSAHELMKLAIDARLGPAAGHDQVVTLLYTHVVGQAPSEQVKQSYVRLLDSGEQTVANLGLWAADLDINKLNIKLVGLTQTGLAYGPFEG
jgi:hypothetical protein